MGGIAQAFESASMSTIEIDDMKYRVRKISSAHLAKVGHAALAVAQGLEQKDPEKDEPDDALMSRIASAPAKQLEGMVKMKDAVVAAGLIAIGDKQEGTWEDVRVCLTAEESDARNGVIWVGALPAEVSTEIFNEVMSLSTDGGRSLERLRQFRARTRNPAGAGPSGTPVQSDASGGA
tara:strand:+ start:2261 stop:2794 length:534 start_codon:yes stop_codon:yes gene_type:complete